MLPPALREQQQWQQEGATRCPAASRAPLQELNQLQQQQQRPGSGLSDCPPEGSGERYAYPEVAAAGYAAGLAAAQLEEFHDGEDAEAAAGDGSSALAAQESWRWQQRRLHVMHSNALFDAPRAQ